MKKQILALLIGSSFLFMVSSQAVIQPTIQAKTIFGSDYTSVSAEKSKICKNTIPKNPIPADLFEATCQGLGGYKIDLYGMDMRGMLTLRYGKTKVGYTSVKPAENGSTVEWRYHTVKGKKQYHGLIHRFYTQKYDEKKGEWLPQDQDDQTLVVMKLAKEKSCIIGIIPASKTMNEQARKLSDNLNAPCKPELNNAD